MSLNTKDTYLYKGLCRIRAVKLFEYRGRYWTDEPMPVAVDTIEEFYNWNELRDTLIEVKGRCGKLKLCLPTGDDNRFYGGCHCFQGQEILPSWQLLNDIQILSLHEKIS